MKNTIENKIKKKLGFTLVEIVVAIAIMGILTAVLAPTLLSYVEDSRKSSDVKLGDEIVEVSKLAVGKTDVFDEVFHYAISNNFLTYSDSSGIYGQQVIDGEFWAPDGMGNATTITFNPVSQNGKMVYVIADGLVNDMVYGNGSVIQPARVMDACDAYAAQCKVNEMTTDDENISAALYGELVRNFGNTIELKSETYRNSSFTIFVTFTYQEDTVTPRVYGYFNGTNLRDSVTSAVGTGTTEVIETPTGPQGNGTNSGTTVSNIDYSGLTGGGAVSYRPFETEEAATLSKDKFFAFCNALPSKDTITSIQFVSDGNRTNATDVSNEQNGKIVAWQEGNKICISASENGKKVKLSANSSHLFDTAFTGLNNIEEIIMHNVNIDSVTNISAMFKGNAKMTYLDINSLTFNRVTDMSYLFSGCASLKQMKYTTWNTSNVTNMSFLFENCKMMPVLPIKGWDTSNVINMSGIFKGCNRITSLDVSSLKTIKCQDFSHMFEECSRLRTLNLSNFIIDNGTSFEAMFKDCFQLESINMSNWEIPATTTNLAEMFSSCKALKSIDCTIFANLTNTAKVTDYNHMFYQCVQIKELDLTNIDTTQATAIDGMFDGMVRLETVILGGKFSFVGNGTTRCLLPEPSELYIEGASGMWINNSGRQFHPRDIPNKVAATYSAIAPTKYAVLAPGNTWWRGTTPQSSIKRIVITNQYKGTSYKEHFNADENNEGGLTVYVDGTIAYLVNNQNQRSSNAFLVSKDCSNMFSDFTSLQVIDGLKLMNTINATNMNNLFSKGSGDSVTGCSQLTTLKGIENWNVQNVQTADYAFAGTGLRSLNLSTWSIANMTSIEGMFSNSKATAIHLTGWDVSNVTNMANLFKNAKQLTEVSLNGWAPRQTAHVTDMFSGCTSLNTILTTETFDLSKAVPSIMFTDCTNLVGEKGTVFSDTSNKMAKLDNETPGYFSKSTNTGSMNAILYDLGSSQSSGTELTQNGTEATPWDYYNGARLLEIKLASMPRDREKIVTITVPAGMYIVENSWTQPNIDVQDVTFQTLDNNPSQSGFQQGTGTYANKQTGTLTYVLPAYARSATIQCMVMFDFVIWDKCKADINTGTTAMTTDPPITVTYNNEITKKINKVTSATNINKGADTGYSLYLSSQTPSCYKDVEFTPWSSNFFLARDQSALRHYFKSLDVVIYAESNSSKQRLRIVKANEPSANTAQPHTVNTNNEGEYKNDEGKYEYHIHWDDFYINSTLHMARPTFIIDSGSEDNPITWVDNETITIYAQATIVTMSGQKRVFNRTTTTSLKSKDLNVNDFVYNGYGASVPQAIYYTEPYHCDVLGYFTAYNKGFADIDNLRFTYAYDTNTASGFEPLLKVMGARVVVPHNQTVDLHITLVDIDGNFHEVEKTNVTNTGSNLYGVFINPMLIASENKLPENQYFLKKIQYTVSSIPGGTTIQNYYSSGGSKSASSAGTFVGRAEGTGYSTLTVEYKNKTTNNMELVNSVVTAKTSITSTPSFSGYIASVNTPLGNSITAGESFQLNIQPAVVSYPYTNSQVFKRPILYIILPEGVNITEDIQVSDTQTGAALDTKPIVKRIKSMEKNGVLSHVYSISFDKDTYLSGCYVSPTGKSVSNGPSYAKWIRLILSTDPAMETASINIKESLYFKDQAGHISISGAYGQYQQLDIYDVDNDGITSDKFGTITDANQSILISGQE